MGEKLKDKLRRLLPASMLEQWRALKKQKRRDALDDARKRGEIIIQEQLVLALTKMGIMAGDHLMVHAAMGKMGLLADGPKTVVDALLEVLGPSGTLCMPSSPVNKLQFDYLMENPVFDVRNTPSAMGAISEYFRNLPETKRSLHPTESVCAIGKLADDLVKDHFGEITPYTQRSPWKKLMEANGKVLYIGVTLDNAGTHLHTLEDAVDFKYPVYADTIFEAQLIDADGNARTMKTKVHNPEFSKRRKCDGLIPMFEAAGALQHVQLGNAKCLLLDAKLMFDTMLKAYRNSGITMYTPQGEKIKGYDE